MSYQMTQVIRKKNKKGPNYKIEKSFYYRLNRCYMLPHKAGFVTLKVLYGVSGNLSFILIFFLLRTFSRGMGKEGK